MAPAKRPAQPAKPQPLRVLFIGNSYTYCNDLPRMFQKLSDAAKLPRRVEVGMVAPGGCTLERHWKQTGARKAIAEGKWSYVVLQDHSLGPIDRPKALKTYGRLLDAEIKKAGAKTVFFLTWARQHKPAMQVDLTREYTAVARELGALLAPIGEAWKRACFNIQRGDYPLRGMPDAHSRDDQGEEERQGLHRPGRIRGGCGAAG